MTYLIQGQVVVIRVLNSVPPLRPLPSAPSVLRGGRQVSFGALQEASHQAASHLKLK